MKKIIPLLILYFVNPTFAETPHPAKWTYTIEEKKDGEAELIFNVKLDHDWHIYSQFTPAGGPLPLVFTFESKSCLTFEGKVTEPRPIEEYDSSFEMKVLYFEKEVEFRQRVKLNKNNCSIKGKIEYQACKEACIFLDTTFIFKIEKGKTGKSEAPENGPYQGSLKENKSISKNPDIVELTPD